MSGNEEHLRRAYLRRHDLESARREPREASQRGRKSQEIGREFQYGMAEIRGETPKNGWQHERPITLDGQTRKHDAARVNEKGGLEFREYKGGRNVGGELTMSQIAQDRRVLERDPHATGLWIMRQGAAAPAVRRELEKLFRDFPQRFQVVEVSNEQAKQARRVGQELGRDRNQLELVNTEQLRRDQRAKERRDRIQQKQQVKEAVQRAAEQRERENRQRKELQQQREAADRLAKRALQRREATDRGERTPMSAREAADILRVSRPTPGAAPLSRNPPPIVPPVKHSRNRSRERERDRSRDIEHER
ncbi:hypothetical protein [Nocardia carnea]|uniref:hypothetical protein n=1 Tax=Nocardia carnea TaxID=37328 RepID=UPI0024560B02|nr:hypothetical protein [Nocardia carnea]